MTLGEMHGIEWHAANSMSQSYVIEFRNGSCVTTNGDPKDLVLGHANLLANIRAIGAALQASSDDVFVSWLYHDLGLIGGWFGYLYFDVAFYAMSPLSFLVRLD